MVETRDRTFSGEVSGPVLFLGEINEMSGESATLMLGPYANSIIKVEQPLKL